MFQIGSGGLFELDMVAFLRRTRGDFDRPVVLHLPSELELIPGIEELFDLDLRLRVVSVVRSLMITARRVFGT